MIYHLYLIAAMIIVGSSVTVGKVVALSMPVYLTLTIRFIAGTVLLVLSVIMLRERINGAKVFAVLLASAGVILVNVSGAGNGGGWSLYGSLLVFAAVVCEALFLLLRKKLPADLSPLALSFYVSFFGFLFFLPFGVYEALNGAFAELTPAGYALIAYYGVFITAAAYIFWFSGIGHVSGSYASVYTSVMPVSAVVLSSLLLGEKVTLLHAAGFGLVLLSMLTLALVRR